MDMRKEGVFCEYFLLISATSQRHAKSLAGAIADKLEEEGARLHHREGYKELLWVLLDYGATVIHIFGEPQIRDFYDLERLWSDVPKLKIE